MKNTLRPHGWRVNCKRPQAYPICTMAFQDTRKCRLCCSFVASTRCSALFSKEAIHKGIPERLSK